MTQKNTDRTVYIVWDASRTEGYISTAEDDAQYAAGLIEASQVHGLGVSTLADDFRTANEDWQEDLLIEKVVLP